MNLRDCFKPAALAHVARDLRYAARMVGKSPSFTTIAVVSLV